MKVKVDCANTQPILEHWLKSNGYTWENRGFTYQFCSRESDVETQEWWDWLVRSAALNDQDLSKVKVLSLSPKPQDWR